MISGRTGSGKATLMKVLLDHVSCEELLIFIEQTAELKIAQPSAVRWVRIPDDVDTDSAAM